MRGHSERMTQPLHRGKLGRQTFWPQVTRYRLMWGHHSRSVAAYSARSVSSGVFVFTHPSRFEMRWTCVSTQMFCRLRNDRMSTRFAVFRPTPGNRRSSSIVLGTLPSNRSSSSLHVAFTCLALVWKKLTGLINFSIWLTESLLIVCGVGAT